MTEPSGTEGGRPRWEYTILWRYGPLGLVVAGAALLAIGLTGLCSTAVSVAALPVGLVLLLAGVALPRVEGVFTAGPHGVSGNVVPVHRLDTYTVTAPAVTAEPAPAEIAGQGGVVLPKAAISGEARVIGELHLQHGPVRMGDVWDALSAASGFCSLGAALGRAILETPDGRVLELANRGAMDSRVASWNLLEQLAAWGVHPVASGRYTKYAAPGLPAAGYTPDDVPVP
jgi:hypothetical protein